MTPFVLLAYIVASWLMLLGTGWIVFVMLTRRKALQEAAALKRRRLEAGLEAQARQERLLGATLEGTGFIPGDAEEAVAEARALRRGQR